LDLSSYCLTLPQRIFPVNDKMQVMRSKIWVLATAAFLATGVSFAHDGGDKGKGKKKTAPKTCGKECGKKHATPKS
jgi:hypothetical protein